MKLLSIVQELVSQGHKIKYRVRTDGGIIVTQVDKKKFTRAGTGNRYVREISGIELSAPRKAQTKYNVEKFIQLQDGYKHKASNKGTPEEIIKLTKKVQRIWRKNKTIGEGKVTIRKVRWYLKEHGIEYTRAYLEQRGRYSEGWAYEKNVGIFANWVRTWASKSEYEGYVDKLMEKFEKYPELVREEEHIQAIHQVIYNKQMSVEQKIQEIEKIVNSIY